MLSLVGCGGSSSDGGYAPDDLSGYILEVNPENADDPNNSPGPLTIAGGAGTGTVGYINGGTEYTAGVMTIFNKTSANQASLICSAINPDNPENPTTQFVRFEAKIDFTSKSTSGYTLGTISNWVYTSYTAGYTNEETGELIPIESKGTGGTVVLKPLQ
jgi:hypothetical protein